MVSSPSLSPIGAKLTPYYNNKSANGRMELIILSQPEEQHRARYLTEGSRGAIKDVSGLGHPIVKLHGYHSRQPIKLECYIGHDKHNGLPHLFYQASKISGKNSTQCTACKVDGTSVIVMNLLPENNMQATIDCVGILKERNVDVEQKLLNLNHSNKSLDFTSTSPAEHHQPPAPTPTSAFAQSAFSVIGQQQQQQQQQQPQQQSIFSPQPIQTSAQAQPALLQQQAQLSSLHPHIQQPQGQLSHLHLHQNGASLYHSQNHNHLAQHEIVKLERNETMSSALDENSMASAMSRADSLDDSCDVSRHSWITSSSLHQKSTIMPEAQTPMMHTSNMVALNSRKRSVRCRLVFRVKIPETGEILQTISTPIICTQPLGTPEICKKSVSKVPTINTGNQELFIIGKNFLKDSKIVFRNTKSDWIKVVEPEKEYLNSSHLVCRIPNYDGPELNSNLSFIEVELQVRSGGKFSEAHSFTFVNTNVGDTESNGNSSTVTSNSSSPLTNTCTTPSPLQLKFGAATPVQQQSTEQPQQAEHQQAPAQQQLSPTQLQLHDRSQLRVQQQYQPEVQPQFDQQQPDQSQQAEQHQQVTAQQLSPTQLQMHTDQPQLRAQQQYQTEVQQQFDHHHQQQQQQQQQQQHVIQEQHQIQRQIILHQQQSQHQQAQAIQTNQIINTMDLNDETTIVYADTLQSQQSLVHNVLQSGSVIGSFAQTGHVTADGPYYHVI